MDELGRGCGLAPGLLKLMGSGTLHVARCTSHVARRTSHVSTSARGTSPVCTWARAPSHVSRGTCLVARDQGSGLMVIVYGAEWCEDTRRSRRLLRRLGVPHQYCNIDEDLDALEKAMALTAGRRRTPVIDLALGGQVSIFDLAQDSRHIEPRDLTPTAAGVLVEPDNDTLTAALVERQMLTAEEARGRLAVQNVGDFERVLRAASGAGLVLAGTLSRRGQWPLRIAGSALALSG